MTVYTPSFTAANSTSGITGFTNRVGVMGINSNSAYPVGSAGLASYNTAMVSDDVTVTATVGSLSGSVDLVQIVLGCSVSGDLAMASFSPNGTVYIFYGTGWSAANIADSTATAPTYTTGTVLTFSRTGNVYTTKVGATTALMWTDAANTIPRDSSHRLVGIGGNASGTNYRRISAMTATDVDTVTTNTSAFFAMF